MKKNSRKPTGISSLLGISLLVAASYTQAQGDWITLIDGTEFDSSYARGEPVELGVNQVIKGWQEALQLMKAGSKWEIAVPSELGYGARGAGGVIGPHSTLLFDIELIEIK